jgi:hypothetical protein
MAGEPMARKSGGPIDDPVIAELLKRKAESAKAIDKKIKERRAQLSKGERYNRNRLFMLTGVAYHTDATLDPQKIAEIKAKLDRAITNAKDREFLKSLGWL